jgi:N-acetylmuramoyl-L-alanine amidase
MRRPGRIVVAAWLALGTLLTAPSQSFAVADEIYNPTSWNGWKIYLSPAKHASDNIGCYTYSENTGALKIARRAKDYLISQGFRVRIGRNDYITNVTNSNAWGSSLHVPIHTNAGTWDLSRGQPC